MTSEQAKTNAQALAIALSAQDNVGDRHNVYAAWDNFIYAIMQDAPNGSGFDCGTSLVSDESFKHDTITFSTSFHYMDENGCYDHWTNYTITASPTWDGFGLDIQSDNPDDDYNMDYIHDCFHAWLSSPCKHTFKMEG